MDNFLRSLLRFVDDLPQGLSQLSEQKSHKEWALALESFKVPVNSKGLLPPRLPLDVILPENLNQIFPLIMEELKQPEKLSAAAKHVLVMLASSVDQLDLLEPVFQMKTGQEKIYQSTLTWINALKPEWFFIDDVDRIAPYVEGSLRRKTTEQFEDYKNKRLVSPIRLKLENQDKSLVNPSQLIVGSIELTMQESLFLNPEMGLWNAAATDLFITANMACHSFWVMGFAKKALFENIIPVNAAFFSPFYSNEDLQNIFNQQLRKQTGVFDLSVGITDLMEKEYCPILSHFIDMRSLVNVVSINSLIGQSLLLNSNQAYYEVPENLLELYLNYYQFTLSPNLVEPFKNLVEKVVIGKQNSAEQIIDLVRRIQIGIYYNTDPQQSNQLKSEIQALNLGYIEGIASTSLDTNKEYSC